jgi:universal stress protein A
MIAFKNILVATDFSEVSDVALSYGRTLAEQFGATLHVVHVVEDLARMTFTTDGLVTPIPGLQKGLEDAARTELDAALARVHGPGPRPQAARVITSNARAAAIVDYAKNASIDLIVIGTHGRGGMSRLLLGSVAERVVRTARCPVLTVNHHERGSVQSEAPPA